MSRTNKGSKPIGYDYWSKRIGNKSGANGCSSYAKHNTHKRERMAESEMLNKMPCYHEQNKIGYDGTHEHPDIVKALSHLGVVKVWVDSNMDYISIDGKYYRELDEWYQDGNIHD